MTQNLIYNNITNIQLVFTAEWPSCHQLKLLILLDVT